MSEDGIIEVKKSSVRLYRDALERRFDQERAEIKAREEKLRDEFNARLQRHAPQILSMTKVQGAISCFGWQAPTIDVRVFLPHTGPENTVVFPASVQQEIAAVKDAGQVIHRQMKTLEASMHAAMVYGQRHDVIHSLLKRRPEGVALLQQLETMALSIAEEELKKQR